LLRRLLLRRLPFRLDLHGCGVQPVKNVPSGDNTLWNYDDDDASVAAE
jgi:hypothetical protein